MPDPGLNYTENVQHIVLETITNENTAGADASWRTVVDLNVKAENDPP